MRIATTWRANSISTPACGGALMKRQIPGLFSIQQFREGPLSGAFLVRVAGVSHRWHPQKPFLTNVVP